jgi:hypothetical protein
MGFDGMGFDGMGFDGMGFDGMGNWNLFGYKCCTSKNGNFVGCETIRIIESELGCLLIRM